MNNSSVKRIYPESKTALINFIEENFHEIEQHVASFQLKDGTIITVYDSFSYLEAVGMAEIAKNSIHTDAYEDNFIPKERT